MIQGADIKGAVPGDYRQSRGTEGYVGIGPYFKRDSGFKAQAAAGHIGNRERGCARRCISARHDVEGAAAGGLAHRGEPAVETDGVAAGDRPVVIGFSGVA